MNHFSVYVKNEEQTPNTSEEGRGGRVGAAI